MYKIKLSNWKLKQKLKTWYTLSKGVIVGSEEHGKRTGGSCLAWHGRKLQERRPFRWIRNSTGLNLNLIWILNSTNLLWIITSCFVVYTDAATFELWFIQFNVKYTLNKNQQDANDHREQNKPNVGLHIPFL
jgi:hypothetical protein